MGDLNLRLRVKIDYSPDGRERVYHPSLGYPFLDYDAQRVIEKYRLADRADFDDIKNLVAEIDFRNKERPLDKLVCVRTIISSEGNPPKLRVYDFISDKISEY